ncbi:hypothetical protein SMNI109538_22875 [Smaragdicoccus niigatensis]
MPRNKTLHSRRPGPDGSVPRPTRVLLSQAEGYPVGVKQFLQFCLILIYPAWLFFVLIAWPIWLGGMALEGMLYVLFWPVRAIHKKNNPEEYAAFQAELKARKEAARTR